ncbi:MAG: DUF1573 domain-containing protein [Gemmatimonadota bacterium]|nr:DUF1573 domain-containing protein [Gemmatimonadota bacterium]
MRETLRNLPFIKIQAVLFISLLPALLPAAAGTPRIHIEGGPVHDFGGIYRGENAEHLFIIRNQGEDTLHINKVRSTCGCTVALLTEKDVAPGEAAELKTTFISGRYKGKIRKNVFVYSDDPRTPITKLSIQVEVLVDLEVSPTQIYFSGLKAGDRLERNITLKNTSAAPISIKEIASTVSCIKFELSRLKIEPGESTRLTLVVDEVTKGMKLTGSLTIFNTSHQDKVSVALYGGEIK